VHFIYSKTHIEVLVNKDYNKRGCLGASVKVKVKRIKEKKNVYCDI
jgi:hypothetical protein